MPMRTAPPLRPLALCLALVLASPLARAATITASIVDAAGKPVANTVVTLTDRDGNVVATARTNAAGAAVFASLAAGSYTLRAAPANRAPVEQTIRVAAADAPTVRLTASPVVARSV